MPFGHLQRREFIALLSGVVTAVPTSARPQRLAMPVVGVLSPEGPKTGNVNGLVQGLGELGYSEGQNIRFEYRWAEGRFDRLAGLAADLIRLQVDVIVAFVTQATEVAKNQTNKIPIVMVGVADPVGAGLVTSLAHPGGNVTGTSSLAAALVGKQLELLTLVVPNIKNVATMFNPTNMTFQTLQINEAKAAAQTLGISLRFLEVRTPSDFESRYRGPGENRCSLDPDRSAVYRELQDPLRAVREIAPYYHDWLQDFRGGRCLNVLWTELFRELQICSSLCGQNPQGIKASRFTH